MDFLRPFFGGAAAGGVDGAASDEPDGKRVKREEAGVSVDGGAGAVGDASTGNGGVRGDAPGAATQLANGGAGGASTTATAGTVAKGDGAAGAQADGGAGSNGEGGFGAAGGGAGADGDSVMKADNGAIGGAGETPQGTLGVVGKGEDKDLGQYAMREIHLRKQEDDGELVYMVIKNDGEEQNMIWLIALKNIFSKQLPNMPKEYIVRLVLDPRHHSMICLKNNAVIGGITYRPFWRQNMGEIAFCAVSANEQVKGYGTRLMNHLKEYVCDKEAMTHLITFADNNAVGYFQKQGFTKDVMMEREKWVGYIKEYDGGTIMECHLSAQVSYTEFPVMIRKQRATVDAKVRELSNAHVVYPGLPQFKNQAAPGPGGVRKPVPIEHIPGVLEAQWKPPGPPRYRLVHPGCGDGTPTYENLNRFMRALVNLVQNHIDVWPFLEAVSAEEVPDYYDVVKDPICMDVIKERVDSGEYYVTLEMFAADFRLMFNNCRLYNAPDTVFFKCATRLEAYFESKVAAGISWKQSRDRSLLLDR